MTGLRKNVSDPVPVHLKPKPWRRTPPEELERRALKRKLKKTRTKISATKNVEKRLLAKLSPPSPIEQTLNDLQKPSDSAPKQNSETQTQESSMPERENFATIEKDVAFKPTERQTEFLAANEKEVFFGGSRGG